MQVLDAIDERAIDDLTARREFFWLDLVDPTPEQLAGLAQRFHWHSLALEDMQKRGQRPKLDRYGDHMLLVFYGARQIGHQAPDVIEVHLVVSGDWVVTVRQGGCNELDELRQRLPADHTKGEQFVVYRILDTLTDTFFPVLDGIDDAIDELEDAIVLGPDDEQLQRIFHLKRSLVTMRRIITPQRDLAARTIEDLADLPGLDPGTRDYFRDVYDHLIRVSDELDNYRELVAGTLDIYLSIVNNNLSQIMKRLTGVTVILAGIGAIAGIFGMSEAGAAFSGGEAGGFWLVALGTVAIAVGAGAVLRRIDWI